MRARNEGDLIMAKSSRNITMALALALALAMAVPAMSETLNIVTIHGPPWGFVGSDGKPTGIMYEIGNRIAEEAGFSYTNVLVPYPRTAVEIESGSADFILRFGNDQMTRVAVPVATVAAMPIILIGPAGTRFSSLSELHGKTVGVVRTSKYVAQFDSDTAIQKYAVKDYVVMTKMLALRRLDAGVGSSVGLFYGAHTAGVKPEELGIPLVLGSNEFILFLSKKNAKPETIKALKEAVRILTARGEIKQVIDRYNKVSGFELPQK
jgi:polar amino acid transport system substrate-binding protein